MHAYPGEALEMVALLKIPGEEERNRGLCVPAKARARCVSGQLPRRPHSPVPCPVVLVILRD